MADVHHKFAEQGQFCTATSKYPVLQYFPVRGRAEPLRLVLAYNGVTWFEPPVEPIYKIMRTDLDNYPFRQLPKYIEDVHGELDISQSNAILRHLGRRFDLYGKDNRDSAFVDMLIDACEDLRGKLKDVWVVKKLDPQAVAEYKASVLAQEDVLKTSSMQGVGMACFEHILEGKAEEGRGPWFLGEQLSVADFALFNMVDLHLEHFQDSMQSFPLLVALHARLAQLNGVKEYLASNERPQMIWLTEWQEALSS